MGKETRAHRHNTIQQSRRRHKKIEKLKVKFLASDPKNKEAVLEKLRRVTATFPAEWSGKVK